VKDYVIQCRFLVSGEGWKVEEVPFSGTYEAAGREASRYARALDGTYGNDHFWTVDLTGPNGSYYQLFHGRLS
jgi:hypothetical protein